MSITEKPPQEKKPPEAGPPFKNKTPEAEMRILASKNLLATKDALGMKMEGLNGAIPAFGPEYTGIAGCIGNLDTHNSPFCSDQIELAMVLSGHPLVMKLLEGDAAPETLDPELLRGARILGGMKILDLGCGLRPTFARVARRLGADVYTVDVIPAGRLDFLEAYFSGEDRRLESSRHIQLDLRNTDASESIARASGGDFDLISESHLDSGWTWREFGDVHFYHGKQLAMGLLKKGGFHFKAYMACGTFASKITMCG